ncbi:trichome birefringence [Striga asiatica]|uniref:Trichome birefringence n=1 Tax=Striga asiatica TaxID=4170 RepID=A0A5A7R954_STRAF|nr:trichome birefringence [Striga asiatica]
MVEKWRNCDFYQGPWVRDKGYPLYQAGFVILTLRKKLRKYDTTCKHYVHIYVEASKENEASTRKKLACSKNEDDDDNDKSDDNKDAHENSGKKVACSENEDED